VSEQRKFGVGQHVAPTCSDEIDDVVGEVGGHARNSLLRRPFLVRAGVTDAAR
jgi:hypothetical protein